MNGDVIMEEETSLRQDPQVRVTVSEKHFNKWLAEQSSIARLKIRCDLAKESLPCLTSLVILVVISNVCPQALTWFVPAVLAWILRDLRKKGA